MTRSPRTPRKLAELRESRAKRCQAVVTGGRCSRAWSVVVPAGSGVAQLCKQHANAQHVELWTDEAERREVKYLRQQQLNYDRMMRGRA